MSVYFITGKLGSGKTLVTVGKIQEYLQKDRKVATNLDLDITKLVKRSSKATYYRLPDKPRIDDLNAIGRGSDDVNEDTYGLIVLDECGTWLNTRSWNDKERTKFIDWMLHARKLGWDILFIIQDISMIDKQVRDALCEHLVVCRRLDRMKIPFISSIVKTLTGIRVTAPKIHTAKVFYGDTESSYVTDRWTYTGKALYDAYDTRQVFKPDVLNHGGEEIDMRALSSSLSRWHLDGRYYQRKPFPKLNHPVDLLLMVTIWPIIYLAKHYAETAARSSAVSR